MIFDENGEVIDARRVISCYHNATRWCYRVMFPDGEQTSVAVLRNTMHVVDGENHLVWSEELFCWKYNFLLKRVIK